MPKDLTSFLARVAFPFFFVYCGCLLAAPLRCHPLVTAFASFFFTRQLRITSHRMHHSNGELGATSRGGKFHAFRFTRGEKNLSRWNRFCPLVCSALKWNRPYVTTIDLHFPIQGETYRNSKLVVFFSFSQLTSVKSAPPCKHFFQAFRVTNVVALVNYENFEPRKLAMKGFHLAF